MNFNEEWFNGANTHDDVEAAIKAKVLELETSISSGASNIEQVAQAVAQLRAALDSLSLSVSDISYPDTTLNTLKKKLDAMDVAIAAAQGGGDLSNYYNKTEVDYALAEKADIDDVVKSISVNGGTAQTPTNGNVNITVSGGSATQEISILFIGNSLLQDAVSYLPLVLKELAPNFIFNFYMWYDAGTTLTQLLSKWNSNGSAEIFSTCENVTSWTNADNSQRMDTFLASGKTFEIVVLEEYFNLKTESGYTAADKQAFNDVIAYIRNHYNKPFKVVSFFHRPRTNAYGETADLAMADEIFGLIYDGVRWQLENTISEGVLPAGIAAYRAMYDSTLNGLGSLGYMSPDGTHAQEGLPSLMQAWVSALWVLSELSIPASINNVQGRVTSANYSSINVPGPNPWDNPQNNIVVGTTAQDRAAMDIAIKAFKEGKRLEMNFISPNGIPAYKIDVTGGSGTQTERVVRLTASVLPADAADTIVWSIVSGDASVSNGLVVYNGSSRTASVVVRAAIASKNIMTDVTIPFSLAAVETPTFSPAAGEIQSGQSVAISCATAGATIYYTLDGSTPSASSTQYSAPIVITANTTIRAIAILNNESSNIATAAYTMQGYKSVTINLTDGENAVSGATIMLSAGGTDYSPTSQEGGLYVFNVLAGTYTLSISKTGFIPHSETIIVAGTETKSVALRSTNLLRNAIVGNAGCMGNSKPTYAIMATIMPSSDAPNDLTNDGAYMQAGNNHRGSIILPRAKADTPVTWQAWKVGDSGVFGGQELTDAKAAYSLVEWPLDVDEIEIKLTNSDYWIGGRVMSKSNTNLAQYTTAAYDQGGNSCVYRLNRTNYPNAFYIAMWFKYQSAGSSWPNPSMSTLGISVTAIVD